MNDKKKLLILTHWFLPGFQAGGLIRVVDRMVNSNLSNHYDIYLLTSNRDFGVKRNYEDIPTNVWLFKEKYKVLYLSLDQVNIRTIKSKIQEITPDIIFLNGIFDPFFNIVPLTLKWLGVINSRLIVSPMGMLMNTAMAHKKFKKTIFLYLFKKTNLQKQIHFHVTSDQEKEAIFRQISSNAKATIIPSFPPEKDKHFKSLLKKEGSVSITYISRIHPVKKNLSYLIKVLKNITVQTSLTIAGPIEDPDYWKYCQKLITTLPDNVSVKYIGKIKNEKVPIIIREHHLFCFPTTGENYGFVIIEALAAGRPILISDQTPWKNLSQHNAGWDLPLDNPEAFVTTIEKVAAMDQDEFNHLCEGALAYARQSIDHEELVNAYREMLDSI